MHKTEAGEKAKTLKKKAQELARDATAAMKAAKTLPEAGEKARELEGQADKALAESEALRPVARLEDLTVWVMEKVKPTKKGSQTYHYWMANWREGGKVRNVHLGSCGKMDEETARQKARAIKAEALAIKDRS
jgi:hypothetical protein